MEGQVEEVLKRRCGRFVALKKVLGFRSRGVLIRLLWVLKPCSLSLVETNGRKHAMPIDLDQECNRLKQANVEVLRQRYAEVFGEPPPRTGNKIWLLRRILWRRQALAQGDLSERA